MRCFRIKSDPLVGQAELVLETEQAEVGALALELTLLAEGLSEAVVILTPTGHRISLSIQEKEEKGRLEARTKVTQVDPKRIAFELSRTQAMYMQATLLRTYRDEMAAVNHIHIEGFMRELPFDLTLFFALSRPPMTPEEIEKLVGD
jgi:hypothetical protein